MTTYTANRTVKGGYYFNTRQWKLEAVEGESGTLPGEPEATFVRVPALMLLAVAPLMGLAFVIAIPFIGLAVLGQQVLMKGFDAVAAVRAHVLRSATVPRR